MAQHCQCTCCTCCTCCTVLFVLKISIHLGPCMSMSIDLKQPEAFWRTSLTPSGSWKVGLTRKRLPAPHRTGRLFESVWEMCSCWRLLHFYLADPGGSLEQGKTHAPRLAIFWLPEMDRNSTGSGHLVWESSREPLRISEARVTRSTDLDQPYRGRMLQLLATEAPNSMCQMTTQRGALRPLHPRWHCRISIDIRWLSWLFGINYEISFNAKLPVRCGMVIGWFGELLAMPVWNSIGWYWLLCLWLLLSIS